MRPAARIGDLAICFCPGFPCGICPPGVIVTGSPNTFVENLPVARIGDIATNCCGCSGACLCPNVIIGGTPRVFVNMRPMAGLGSPITCGLVIGFAVRTYIGF